jgi:hypothetical protein
MTLPPLSLGGAQLGGQYGPLSQAEVTTLVRTAIDRGINLIDTSPYYGATHSETVLGHALAGLPREHFQIATKCGRYDHTDFDFSAPPPRPQPRRKPPPPRPRLYRYLPDPRHRTRLARADRQRVAPRPRPPQASWQSRPHRHHRSAPQNLHDHPAAVPRRYDHQLRPLHAL